MYLLVQGEEHPSNFYLRVMELLKKLLKMLLKKLLKMLLKKLLKKLLKFYKSLYKCVRIESMPQTFVF